MFCGFCWGEKSKRTLTAENGSAFAYKLVFLFFAEERNLGFGPKKIEFFCMWQASPTKKKHHQGHVGLAFKAETVTKYMEKSLYPFQKISLSLRVK